MGFREYQPIEPHSKVFYDPATRSFIKPGNWASRHSLLTEEELKELCAEKLEDSLMKYSPANPELTD